METFSKDNINSLIIDIHEVKKSKESKKNK